MSRQPVTKLAQTLTRDQWVEIFHLGDRDVQRKLGGNDFRILQHGVSAKQAGTITAGEWREIYEDAWDLLFNSATVQGRDWKARIRRAGLRSIIGILDDAHVGACEMCGAVVGLPHHDQNVRYKATPGPTVTLHATRSYSDDNYTRGRVCMICLAGIRAMKKGGAK